MKNLAALLIVLTTLLVACGGEPEATPTATLRPTQVAVAAATATPRPATAAPEPSATSVPPAATATSPPPPTATPIPPSATPMPPTPTPSFDSVVVSLQGLSLEEFFEESYKQLLLRRPQLITSLGRAAEYGVRNDRLDDLSDAYLKETQALETAILEILRGYRPEEIPAELSVPYDVYAWYLEDRVAGHPYIYHDYPVHHFLYGYHDVLVDLFTVEQPLATREDTEDYVARLGQVERQVDQLLEGLRRRRDLGVVPPDFIVQMSLQGIARHLNWTSGTRDAVYAYSLPVYNYFQRRLTNIPDLDAAEKEALLAAALQAVEDSFIPGFLALYEQMQALLRVATSDAGAWKLPDGEAYYAYVLRRETSTDLTADEIHQIGLAEVSRIQGEMRAIFEELGYPADGSLGELMDRAIAEGGSYDTTSGGGTVIAAYEAIGAEVEAHLDEVFDLRPRAEVTIVGERDFGGGGGYYTPGSLDGSRPGAFHTGIGCCQVAKYGMPTMYYHEAVPGHHFQAALAQELELPSFMNDLVVNAYVEGWGLYAERLGWEMGLTEGDPYANLGRLHLELLRAVRLVTDTGIHAMRWSRQEARAYMNEAMGDPSGRFASEVDRYVVLPGQATGYKIGMMKILELRQKAMDALGDDFDIREFHNAVLGSGSLPLLVLERVVDDYIESQQQGG